MVFLILTVAHCFPFFGGGGGGVAGLLDGLALPEAPFVLSGDFPSWSLLDGGWALLSFDISNYLSSSAEVAAESLASLATGS